MTLTTRNARLVETAGASSSERWQQERSQNHTGRKWELLSGEVALHVKDVYVRLGHPDLLERCLKVETQNANESLHSKIWAKCPKTGFVGLTRVLAAMCGAVAEFNQGVELTAARLFSVMGMTSGSQLQLSAAKADERRLEKSRHQVLDSTREARRARTVARAHAKDASYQAGAF